METYRIESLTFTYPGRMGEQPAKAATSPGQWLPALDNISLAIDKGAFVALCGPSGCGKTTLLRQLKPSLTPHGVKSGAIYFEGRPLEEVSLRDAAAKIGFVMQSPENQIVTDKVWHELAFGLESLGFSTPEIRLRVAEMASFFGIQEWFHRAVTELSGGQKQLLALASIMALQPSVLILDEPTSQLDPIAAGEFLAAVGKINRELGVTVILTEHRLEEVFPLSDRAVVMDRGTIIADGAPREAGLALRERGHGMFLAMPAPMRIWAAVPNDLPCPVTVRDGKRWLEQMPLKRASEAQRQTPGEIDLFRNRTMPDLRDEFPPGKEGATPRTRQQVRKERLTRLDGNSAAKAVLDGYERGLIRNGAIPAVELDEVWFKYNTNAQRPTPGETRSGAIPAVELDEVWFKYGANLPDVIKGLSFKAYPGEFTAILGGNGTGKTTALSLITRLNAPYRGKVKINGLDIAKIANLFDGLLGALPQNPQALFVKKTVREDLLEILSEMKLTKSEKLSRLAKMAALCRLEGLLNSHPYDLSGGEQQRAALAKVLLLGPRILLLDEPTKGLDAEFKRTFAGILKNLTAAGAAVIMVSHDVEFCAEFADRCALFFDGGVVSEGPPRAFFSGNSFYTSSANRMARGVLPHAVTVGDVAAALGGERPDKYIPPPDDEVSYEPREVNEPKRPAGKAPPDDEVSYEPRDVSEPKRPAGKAPPDDEVSYEPREVSEPKRPAGKAPPDDEVSYEPRETGEPKRPAGKAPPDYEVSYEPREVNEPKRPAGKAKPDDGVSYEPREAREPKRPAGKAKLPLSRKISAAVCALALLASIVSGVSQFDGLKAFMSSGDIASGGPQNTAAVWRYVIITLGLAAGAIGLVLSLTRKHGRRAPTAAPVKRGLTKRTAVAAAMILLAVPLTIYVGTYFFGDRKYYFVSLLIILETMLPFALIFESRKPQARELVIIAALCAIAVAGRSAFFMLPQFKPVAALVIISGVALGGEAGFLVGAMTGFVSNMFFGQGPWTPWQMFAFGIIGFLAGTLSRMGLLRRRPVSLAVFGGFATFVIYGGIMNPANVLMFQSSPTKEMFYAAYLQGIPFDLIHAAATVTFMMLISGAMLEKLDRIKAKYGLY